MFATRGKHHKEKGQGLVEYALVILLVAVVVVGALTLLGTSLSSLFTSIVPYL
jgi:pilus assembly protein Flp/PilA